MKSEATEMLEEFSEEDISADDLLKMYKLKRNVESLKLEVGKILKNYKDIKKDCNIASKEVNGNFKR
jgi:hypothetical protein